MIDGNYQLIICLTVFLSIVHKYRRVRDFQLMFYAMTYPRVPGFNIKMFHFVGHFWHLQLLQIYHQEKCDCQLLFRSHRILKSSWSHDSKCLLLADFYYFLIFNNRYTLK